MDEQIKALEGQTMSLWIELSGLKEQRKELSERLNALDNEIDKKIIANNSICEAISALKALSATK